MCLKASHLGEDYQDTRIFASMPQDMAFIYSSACDHSHDFSGGPSTYQEGSLPLEKDNGSGDRNIKT